MKNKMKYLVVFVLALVLCFSFSGGILATQSFSDIDGHWAESYILEAAENGYVDGYPDGTFRPNANITRAELTKIFAEILSLENHNEVNFSDVLTGKWYTSYVNSAAYAGFIDGYPNGTFLPNNLVTRQEAAKMLGYCVPDNAADIGGINIFSDKASIAAWAAPYVEVVANKGYFQGDKEKRFSPSSNLTRAEAATILVRMTEGETIISDASLASGDAVADSVAVCDGVSFSNCIYSNGIRNLTGRSLINCVLLGSSNFSGMVTIQNVRANAIVNDESLVLTFIGSAIRRFTANAPVRILGTGSIGTLNQNVPDENFSSNIQPTTIVENQPAEAYYVQIAMEYNNDTYVLNISYGSDDTLFTALEKFLDNPSNAAAIQANLIVPMNENMDDIKALKVNGVTLYSEAGWALAMGLFDGTGANAAALAKLEPDFDGSITLATLQNFMDGFNGLYPAGLSDANRSIMINNFLAMNLTTDPVVFSFMDNQGTLTDNAQIGNHWINRILWTGDNVDTFFAKVGDEVNLTATNGDKTISVTVKQITLVQ